MSHQPIEPQHLAAMQRVAAILSDVFDGYGFALLVFPFDGDDGRMNWISNADRADMLVALRAFIAAGEGRMLEAPGVPQ